MKPRVSYSPLRGTFSIRVGDHDAERITIGAVGAFSSVNRGGSATLPGRSRPSNSELAGAAAPETASLHTRARKCSAFDLDWRRADCLFPCCDCLDDCDPDAVEERIDLRSALFSERAA
jgi:hypothetical protein